MGANLNVVLNTRRESMSTHKGRIFRGLPMRFPSQIPKKKSVTQGVGTLEKRKLR